MRISTRAPEGLWALNAQLATLLGDSVVGVLGEDRPSSSQELGVRVRAGGWGNLRGQVSYLESVA